MHRRINDPRLNRGQEFAYRFKIRVAIFGPKAQFKGAFNGSSDKPGEDFDFYAPNVDTALSKIYAEFLPNDPRPISNENALKWHTGPYIFLPCPACSRMFYGDELAPKITAMHNIIRCPDCNAEIGHITRG